MSKKQERKEIKAGKKNKADTIAYRLKCAKTANGLSHFVMYGDAPKEKILL